jgi:hypothetical protein
MVGRPMLTAGTKVVLDRLAASHPEPVPVAAVDEAVRREVGALHPRAVRRHLHRAGQIEYVEVADASEAVVRCCVLGPHQTTPGA